MPFTVTIYKKHIQKKSESTRRNKGAGPYARNLLLPVYMVESISGKESQSFSGDADMIVKKTISIKYDLS